MKREFTIDRQGKTFVLFAGLLDAAHEKGLRSIKTQMLQAPTKENGEMSIFRAVVELEDGRIFEGTGDATPQNVGRNIVPHALRMAETRAKARALRDALNIGGAALEELGGEDDDDHPPARQPVRQQPTPSRPANVDRDEVVQQGQVDEQRHVPRPPEPSLQQQAVSGSAPVDAGATMAKLWETAREAVAYLRRLNVTDVGLPAETSNAAELDAFINDARIQARAAKARQGARR